MAILGYAERSTTMFFEAVKEMESICYFASEISTKRALLLKNDIKSILNNIEKKCVAADTLCHDSNLAISAQSPQSLMRMGYAILISEKT